MIPTSTQAKLSVDSRVPSDAQAYAIFVGEDQSIGASARSILGPEPIAAAQRLLSAGAASGKAKEIVFNLLNESKKPRRVYVVGLGKSSGVTPEIIRQSAGGLVKAVRKHHIEKVAIVLPRISQVDLPNSTEAVVSGILLAAFDYREQKGAASEKPDDAAANLKLQFTIVEEPKMIKAVQSAANEAMTICDGQNYARTIASRPGNEVNPPVLAAESKKLAREAGLRCTILDEKQLLKLGMGGILGVGGGSIYAPPRLIVLEHKPAKCVNRRPLLVVGKAVTFDTGGISIKPADKMGKMIYDKCGAMTVLGLMYSVAKLKLPVHVVGILSSAENAISSRAYRPGDILKMYNGVTVEVTNTDAEGRLVLGDALAWGIEKFKPAAVVDLATLTGGVIVALGKTMAGVMSNSDELVHHLSRAADTAGEKIWRLPFGEDQREQIKSDMADIVNSAGREGHPLQGGAFLSYFIPGDHRPWAHLDIAGVADTEKDMPYYGKGATGWGVRTLVNWVRDRQGAKTRGKRETRNPKPE